jgi:hypothetical protein
MMEGELRIVGPDFEMRVNYQTAGLLEQGRQQRSSADHFATLL